MKTTYIITVLVELPSGQSFYNDWRGSSENAIRRMVRNRYPDAVSIEFGQATAHHSFGAH